jgi:hypothetical protein
VKDCFVKKQVFSNRIKSKDWRLTFPFIDHSFERSVPPYFFSLDFLWFVEKLYGTILHFMLVDALGEMILPRRIGVRGFRGHLLR